MESDSLKFHNISNLSENCEWGVPRKLDEGGQWPQTLHEKFPKTDIH